MCYKLKRFLNIKKPSLKVEYTLTEFGKTLTPMLKQIVEWGLYAAETRGEFLFEK